MSDNSVFTNRAYCIGRTVLDTIDNLWTNWKVNVWCMYAPPWIFVYINQMFFFFRRMSWQTQCLNGTLTFQAKWGKTREWEKPRVRETQLECKRQTEWPLFFQPLGSEAITFEATTLYTYTSPSIYHTHEDLILLLTCQCFYTKGQVLNKRYFDINVDRVLLSFPVSTFECLSINNPLSSTMTPLTLFLQVDEHQVSFKEPAYTQYLRKIT